MITVKLEGFDDLKAMLDPDIAKRATRSAIDKLSKQAKTEASSVIRERYNIKKGDLDPKMKIDPPRVDNLRAVISVTGRPISLTYFGAKQLTAQNRIITRTSGRQLKRAGRNQLGVTYSIAKGQPPRTLPHAFIATMKNGHIGVFMRKGLGRSIIERNMVTLATLFGGKVTMEKVQQLVQQKWPGIMKNEWLFFSKKK